MNHHRMSHRQTREGMSSVGGTVVRVSRAGAGQLSLEELPPILFWEQGESSHQGRTQST